VSGSWSPPYPTVDPDALRERVGSGPRLLRTPLSQIGVELASMWAMSVSGGRLATTCAPTFLKRLEQLARNENTRCFPSSPLLSECNCSVILNVDACPPAAPRGDVNFWHQVSHTGHLRLNQQETRVRINGKTPSRFSDPRTGRGSRFGVLYLGESLTPMMLFNSAWSSKSPPMK
jgi:hypothetical protein